MSGRRDKCMRLNGKAGEKTHGKKKWRKPDPRKKPSIENALARIRLMQEKHRRMRLEHRWRGL